MAGIDKLLKHLLQEPPPTNFTWEELVSLLSSFGFQEKTNSGSSRKFVHKETNNKIFLHKPHPHNHLKIYAIKQVIAKLEDMNLL